MTETEGWILHTRPYQNTSLLLDVFTEQYGRMKLLARGAHRVKNGVTLAQSLQPYRLLWFHFGGKSELKLLYQADTLPNQTHLTLTGKAHLCALYIHELLIKLLPTEFHLTQSYLAYSELLNHLNINHLNQVLLAENLRNFEQIFLTELGYAPDYAAHPHLSKQQVHQYLFAPLLNNQPLQTREMWQKLYLKS